MGVPNIQQQLYLMKALNENTDGMFDHPEVQPEETITEGLMGKIKSIVRKVKQRGLKGAVTKSGAKDYVKNKIAGNRSVGQYHLRDKNTAAADKSYNKVAGYQKFSNKISEGSIGAGKIFSGKKGNKFHPEKDRKYYTKTAVRQLIKRGKDPNLIKISSTQGLENRGFHVNADDKRKEALRVKGLANFGFGVNAIIKRKAALKAKGKYT